MFNLINLSDAKGLVPVAVTALIGVAIWYLWKRAQDHRSANNLDSLESGLSGQGGGTNVADLALLAQILHPNTGATTQATGTAVGGFGNAPAQQPATASNAFESNPVTQGAG
jgi:hypothetical protein